MSIYFDNAATSWPKPRSVIKEMSRYFAKVGGNPGRSGHRKAIDAGRIVLSCRENIGKLFGIKDPSRIIFTKNATEALNIVLFGVLREGDHCITTSMEHNSVLRPAGILSRRGIELDIAEGDLSGFVDPKVVLEKIREGTKLVCVNHASNVTGTIQDIETIARGCRERQVSLLVDAAQTAGALEIDCEGLGIDFLAASGHKGLLGPQGTGVLYVKGDAPAPLMYGGTGSLSDSEAQPEFFPDCLESGTLNVIGIAGLNAGIEYLLKRGMDKIREDELILIERFLFGLREIPGVKIYGPEAAADRTGAFSVTIAEVSPSEAGELLDDDFGILTRIGLHCAPRAHKTIGTFPEGTVRFGIGPFTKKREIDSALRAVGIIARRGR